MRLLFLIVAAVLFCASILNCIYQLRGLDIVPEVIQATEIPVAIGQVWKYNTQFDPFEINPTTKVKVQEIKGDYLKYLCLDGKYKDLVIVIRTASLQEIAHPVVAWADHEAQYRKLVDNIRSR